MSGLGFLPGGFEFGEGDDLTAPYSDPFEALFASVQVISFHDAVNGGSSDVGSVSLQNISDPLWAVSGELVHSCEDEFFDLGRGLVMWMGSSDAVLETVEPFDAEVVTPLIEPSS